MSAHSASRWRTARHRWASLRPRPETEHDYPGRGWIEDGGDGHCYNTYVPMDGTYHAHRKLYAFEHPVIRAAVINTPAFDTPWERAICCWDNNLAEKTACLRTDGADIILAFAPDRRHLFTQSKVRKRNRFRWTLGKERDKHPEASYARLSGRAHDVRLADALAAGKGRSDNGVILSVQ